ncbi:MAG TPA: SRPBCC domain-containing protein [Anaerolineales bacterium]
MSQELTLKRIFDAPRELVFKAWTDPKLVAQWWGPTVFTNPVCELDPKPGGKIHIVMRGPANSDFDSDFPMTGTFKEVDAPQRLVYTSEAYMDGLSGPQIETLTTVTFADKGGKTEMTLHVVVVRSTPAAAGALQGMEAGWTQSLEKLNDLAGQLKSDTGKHKIKFAAEPGKQEVIVTRTFDASPELIFKTMTDPGLIPQWWGPRDLTTTVEKMEVRPGGQWRFVQRDPQGEQFGFHGVYHDVTPSERLVYTFEFEGFPGHVLLETVTFEEQNGKTLVTDQSVYQSVEDRDGMVQTGMESGATESMERLVELLVKV